MLTLWFAVRPTVIKQITVVLHMDGFFKASVLTVTLGIGAQNRDVINGLSRVQNIRSGLSTEERRLG